MSNSCRSTTPNPQTNKAYNPEKQCHFCEKVFEEIDKPKIIRCSQCPYIFDEYCISTLLLTNSSTVRNSLNSPDKIRTWVCPSCNHRCQCQKCRKCYDCGSKTSDLENYNEIISQFDINEQIRKEIIDENNKYSALFEHNDSSVIMYIYYCMNCKETFRKYIEETKANYDSKNMIPLPMSNDDSSQTTSQNGNENHMMMNQGIGYSNTRQGNQSQVMKEMNPCQAMNNMNQNQPNMLNMPNMPNMSNNRPNMSMNNPNMPNPSNRSNMPYLPNMPNPSHRPKNLNMPNMLDMPDMFDMTSAESKSLDQINNESQIITKKISLVLKDISYYYHTNNDINKMQSCTSYLYQLIMNYYDLIHFSNFDALVNIQKYLDINRIYNNTDDLMQTENSLMEKAEIIDKDIKDMREQHYKFNTCFTNFLNAAIDKGYPRPPMERMERGFDPRGNPPMNYNPYGPNNMNRDMGYPMPYEYHMREGAGLQGRPNMIQFNRPNPNQPQNIDYNPYEMYNNPPLNNGMRNMNNNK